MRVVNDFTSKTDEGTSRRGFMASGLTPFGAMPRIDYICANGLFRRHLGNIAQLESGRIFCRHGIDHLLDVARIMWIKNLEEQLEFDREVIYATALLHDIGKDEQYESGISHDVASERVADAILGGMPDDVAFEPADAAAIKTAILGHRKLRVNSQPLERLLYAADKASRACFACPARNACNWSEDKKNLSIGGADRKLDREAVRTGGSHVQQGEGRALPPGDGGRHGAHRRRGVRGGHGERGQEVGDGAPPAQLHRRGL